MSLPRLPRLPVGRWLSLVLLTALLLPLNGTTVSHAASSALAITITDTRLSAEPGDLLTYTLRIRNTGSTALSDVRARVTLPAEVSFVGASDSPTALGGGSYEWSIGPLGAGWTLFRYLTVQVNAALASGTIISTIAAVDQLGDVTPNTATDTTTVSAPTVSLSPTSLNFADQLIHTTSAAQSITLTNSGTAPLAISAISAGGDFDQTNDCPLSPATLAAQSSCTVSVTFTPSTTGPRNGTLTISSNAVDSPHTVSLSGTGIGPATSFDRAVLDFGAQRVGTTSAPQSVTLTNSGSAPLTISLISINGDFAIDSRTCRLGTTLAAQASCTISITFTPSTTGTRNGTLTIVSNSPSSPDLIALTGVGAQPSVSLSASSLDFGAQRVGTTSAAQTVTLTNNGLVTIAVGPISAGGDFAQTNDCPATLTPGTSCTVSVTFTPSTTGARSATLTIVDDALGNPHTVSLTGIGTQPSVSLDQTSLDFGTQRVSTTSAAQTVTLTNSGSAPLTIASLSIPVGSDFAISATTCPLSPATLAAGTSCTVSIRFTPSTTGTRNATLTITDDAAGSPHTVSLTGIGTQPAVSLSPAPLDFGTQRVSTTSAPQTITITNPGSAPLSISSMSLAPGGEFSFAGTTCPLSPATLAAGTSCTVSVTFTPSATGTRSATFAMNSNAPGSPHTVSLVGIGALPGVILSPTPLDFGTQRVGTTSAARTVTLTNSGGMALNISSLTITPGGEFALDSTTCPLSPATLAAGTSCTVSIRFTPSTTGARSATLSVTDDAPGSPHTVSLSGTGVEPSASLDQTSLDFGSQEVNTTSAPQSVTLSNTGSGPLTISTISAGGDYTQTNNCPTTLAANTSCTVSIAFRPTATGTRNAALTVIDDAAGSPRTVSLSGIGIQSTVELSPTSLDFGSQPVAQASAPQSITLTNSGTAPLAISAISAGGDFTVSSTDCPLSPATLAINTSCTVSVTFTPSASGPRSATLTITSNAAGSPHTLGLSGTGLAPVVSLDRSGLDFGTQRVGTTSAPQSITLTNSGTAPLAISAISAGADFTVSGSTCPLSPATLAINASCTISVTFTPSTTGTRSAALSLSDDAAGSPHTVSLTGSGVEPGVYLSASSIAFGTQRLSLPSTPRSVTLRNNGLDTLSIQTIQTSSDYTQTNDCPTTLAPDASCTISVVFTPSMTGPRSGTLTISDDATGSPRTVNLSGTGAIVFNLPIDFKLFLPLLSHQ